MVIELCFVGVVFLVVGAHRLTHRSAPLEVVRTLTLTVLSPGEDVTVDDLVERILGKEFIDRNSVVRGLYQVEHEGLISVDWVLTGSGSNPISTYYARLTQYGVEKRAVLLNGGAVPYRS